jgi:succinylarginine dihydrolase
VIAREWNFDGLVGPTHNYAGLAHGNLAAQANQGLVSNPKAAALQGLAKMRALMRLGVPQAVLPPHERPHVETLRRMGFSGPEAEMLRMAGMASPVLLANVTSASAMWTANAATVTPSADASDGRLHLTPANLASHFHRALEAPFTTRLLRKVFADETRFAVHEAVPFPVFGDEGAANHCRLAPEHGAPGVEIFVYGRSAFGRRGETGRFIPRQALEACHIVASTHGLRRGGAMIEQQSPTAIDAGAFHNDVVCVSNGPVLFYHRHAFADPEGVRTRAMRSAEALGFEAILIEVADSELSLDDAVRSYLFNSQIVTPPEGGMAFILPTEVDETPTARAVVERVLDSGGPIREAHYLNLRESMRNGGGPACLRLRVAMTDEEARNLGAGVALDVEKVEQLEAVVNRWYRDRLTPDDLADPALLDESRHALDEFSAILGLGAVYDFQQG